MYFDSIARISADLFTARREQILIQLSLVNFADAFIDRIWQCRYTNPPNNFCGLALDKTDHVIQYQTISAVRFDIRLVKFYFDGRKTKKQANVHAKLLIGQGKPK